ncbi:MAG: hypothetical protein ACJ8F7_00585 [Gemmataceae bacterium]
MPVTISSFSPNTKLSDGRYGLNRKKGSKSKATIKGTGLTNGLPVNIKYPGESEEPQMKWTGTTANSNADNTQCDVELTQEREGKINEDDPGGISVTTGDSTPPKPFKVPLGIA